MPDKGYLRRRIAWIEREVELLIVAQGPMQRDRQTRRKIRMLSQQWQTLLHEAEDAGFFAGEVSPHWKEMEEEMRRGRRGA